MNEITTTTEQKLTLPKRITALQDQLRPRVDVKATARALQALRAAGLGMPTAIDPAQAPTVYAYALEDISAAALHETTKRLIKGLIDRPDMGFIPRPPELAALCRQHARIMVEDLRRMRETFDALSTPKPEPKSEEAKAKVRALVERVRKAATPPEDLPHNAGSDIIAATHGNLRQDAASTEPARP